jgi:hypothetical protein
MPQSVACSELRDYPKTSTVILSEAKDLRGSDILSAFFPPFIPDEI